MRLEGKVAIVTGAGSGLGRAAALLFSEEGARVVVADVDEGRAAGVTKEIHGQGGEAMAATLDVSNDAQVAAMTDQTVAEYGKLDILYCNAGVIGPRGPFLEQKAEDWRQVFDVNVVGILNCVQKALPHFRANGGGVILMTSSGAALVGIPGVPSYSAAKGAITALGRALAVDLGPENVRVNTLCPMGGMSANFMLPPGSPLVDETSLFTDYSPADSPGPLARPSPPRLIDHARAALFLVSDDAAWVHGVALPTDGGAIIRPQMDVERTIRAYETAKFKSTDGN